MTVRIVRYMDPETGAEYEFQTSVDDLEPGVIALLYLTRWRIEKVFETTKNKLEETRSCAVGETAQEIRAHVLALTHNLLVLLRGGWIASTACGRRRSSGSASRRRSAARDGRKRPDWRAPSNAKGAPPLRRRPESQCRCRKSFAAFEHVTQKVVTVSLREHLTDVGQGNSFDESRTRLNEVVDPLAHGAGCRRGVGRSESMACLNGALLMWVYFRWISAERSPVSFIRISSETPALANAGEKLCRKAWKVRLAKFRVPFPFTIIRSSPARFTTRLKASLNWCCPPGVLPKSPGAKGHVDVGRAHVVQVLDQSRMQRDDDHLLGLLRQVHDEALGGVDVVPGHRHAIAQTRPQVEAE